jgi:hypothetical protein
MFTKQVSRPVDGLDPPLWSRRPSRSNELQEDLVTRPIRGILCSTGTRPVHQQARRARGSGGPLLVDHGLTHECVRDRPPKPTVLLGAEHLVEPSVRLVDLQPALLSSATRSRSSPTPSQLSSSSTSRSWPARRISRTRRRQSGGSSAFAVTPRGAGHGDTSISRCHSAEDRQHHASER